MVRLFSNPVQPFSIAIYLNIPQLHTHTRQSTAIIIYVEVISQDLMSSAIFYSNSVGTFEF